MKYIIGSGLSGLIFKFYNPDYEIISDQHKGKLANPFFSNILYFHKDEWSEKLLKDLKVPYKIKNIAIRYLVFDEKTNIGKFSSIISDDTKRKIIANKARLNKKSIEDTKLSVEDNFISYLEFDINLFFKRITPKNAITDKVIKINKDTIVTEKTVYPYEHLVSTMPAQIFWSLFYDLSYLKTSLKAFGTYFEVREELPEVYRYDFDMLYVDDPFIPELSRISRRSGKYLLEFTTQDVVNSDNYKLFFTKSPDYHYYDNNAIIHTNLNNIPPPNIDFVGRFAVHQHQYKQSDAIRFSCMNTDFKYIFQRQKNFSANYIDYNRIKKDEVYKRENIQKYVLACIGQLSDLVSKTGFKDHLKFDKLDQEGTKKELMDVFKYFLNISLCLEVDVFEFIELFNKVSSLVEKEQKLK